MTSRVRLAATAALLAAVAVAAVLALAAGRGEAGTDATRLAWQGEVTVFAPDGLPDDRILQARLRNTSLRPVDLAVGDVRVLDAEGEALKSSARFLQAFAHGLYPPDERDESQIGDFEKRRLGEIVTLRPGQSVPVTLSWRGGPAERIDLGVAGLPLP